MKNEMILKRTAAAAVLLAALVFTGCGVGANAGNGTPAATLLSDASVRGRAMGGQQPVTGSAVTLYATGSSYGAGAVTLGTATSDANGNFTIARNSNTCANPQQVYLTAVGGNPGLSGTVNNTAIVMVAALGACSSVTAQTLANIDEVTTIAAAYALSGFASGSTLAIGTSATNTLGLTAAFNNAASLASFGLGLANSTTAGGNGTVPSAVINSLADILQSCVNSSSSNSSTCASLFAAAQPPAVTGIAAPVNSWQAALDIAQFSGNNAAALFAQIGASAAFQPALSAAPEDWTISIEYTLGMSNTTPATPVYHPSSLTIDANDNVWLAGSTGAYLVELSSAGAILSPAGGDAATQFADYTTTPSLRQEGIDSNGNVWIADNGNGNVLEYIPSSGAMNTYPAYGQVVNKKSTTNLNPGSLALDKNNNVFFTTQKSGNTNAYFGVLYASQSYALSANNLFAFGAAGPGAEFLTVDALTGNAYAGVSSTDDLVTLPNGGTVSSPSYTTSGSVATPSNSLGNGLDKSENLWFVTDVVGTDGGVLYELPKGGSTYNATSYTISTGGGYGLYDSRGLVVDGNNRIFIADFAIGTVAEFDPATSSFYTTATGDGYDSVDSSGDTTFNRGTDSSDGIKNMGVDSAGALWIANGNANSDYGAFQVFGIAAPINPVLSAGSYGVKP